MGLRITIAIHQADDVEFDDLKALNDDLMNNTAFGELYDGMEQADNFDGPFIVEDDELKIACNSDNYFESYDNYTQVWGCFGVTEAAVIAKHMTAGKLVFFMDIEGNDNEYYILTQGQVAHKSANEIRF